MSERDAFSGSAATAALEAIDILKPEERGALAGGLALVPANLHHLARLETLGMSATARTADGRRSATRTSARRLLNDLLGDWVGYLDDPCETLATHAFTYNGGTHVFVAPDPDRLYALTILARLIARETELPAAFVTASVGAIQGICALSDLIAERAGLPRNLPTPTVQATVVVPPDADLKRLLAAVRVTHDELSALSVKTMFRQFDIDALSLSPGRQVPLDPFGAAERLVATPLLKTDAGVVVVAPHRLVEALVLRLAKIAIEFGVGAQIAEAFHLHSLIRVERDLERLGMKRSSEAYRPFTTVKGANVAHALYQFDSDKMLHLVLISSDCDASLASEPLSIDSELEAARSMVSNLLAEADPRIDRWFTLVVGNLLSSRSGFSCPAPGIDQPGLVAFSAADVESIVDAGPARHPLILWKYQRALSDLGPETKLIFSAPLDVYAAWSENEYVFPNGPTTLAFDGSFTALLRARAVANYDWHAVASQETGRTIEVGLADGPEQPIFIPRAASRRDVKFIVDRPGIVLWIVSKTDIQDVNFTERLDVGRMMAYWIAEFSGALVAEFRSLAAMHDVVTVQFDLLNDGVPGESTGYSIVSTSSGALRVVVHDSFVTGYDRMNTRERHFASELVTAILAPVAGNEFAANAVKRVLDAVAPLGVKRMMHRIDTSLLPEFIASKSLPAPTYAHQADVARVRRKTLRALPRLDSPLRGAQAKDWLNAGVGHVYIDLRAFLSEFEPRAVLHTLLTNNESLVHQDAIEGLTLASQLACYRPGEAAEQRLLKRRPRHASASLVTRFLVEHIAAEPPGGTRRVSDLDLDTLLAMGLEIVACGIASDVARYELADVELRLENEDLVVDRGTYEAASQGSLLASTRDDLQGEYARERVRDGRRATTTERPARADRIESASEQEFGAPLSVLLGVLGEAVALGMERQLPVVVVPRDEFFLRACEGLGVQGQTVSAAIDALTLSPRASYLDAPAGFDKGDIWPWRFNRALSYLRRPLVQTRGDNADLHFTPGHAFRASRNLVGLIANGRLKARSRTFAAVMGEFTREASDAFNEEVAEAFLKHGFVVRVQTAKFGKKRMLDRNKNALGDVDVLCVDVLRRRMLAIECKDFQVARVPHEVRLDLDALFISREGSRCAQDKHLARVDWIRENASLVASAMGLPMPMGEWRVEGGFVFSVPLISPLLGHAKLPIWTLNELRNIRP